MAEELSLPEYLNERIELFGDFALLCDKAKRMGIDKEFVLKAISNCPVWDQIHTESDEEARYIRDAAVDEVRKDLGIEDV